MLLTLAAAGGNPAAAQEAAPDPVAAPTGRQSAPDAVIPVPCRPTPVHTASLVERVHRDHLAGEASPDRWIPDTRLSDRVVECARALDEGRYRLVALPGAMEFRHNTGFPRPMVDGSFRPGRGLMLGIVQGIAAQAGPVTLVIRPELHHHRNQAFPTVEMRVANHSSFIHPSVGTRIDLPQRFGSQPFTVISPGQSTIRLDWRGLAGGLSTENAWWGPALRNPLLLSSAGPGFPHVFIGTARPLDVRIGSLYLRTLVGRLTESPYFDVDPSNDHQLISGTILAFHPAFLPGFTLGAARFFAMRDDPDLGIPTFLRSAFTGIRDNPLGEDNPFSDNQHASVFARWAFPDAGLEVYGEFARIDHWGRWFELLSSPQASAASMWGLQKAFAGDAATWRVLFEAVSLVDPMPSLLPGRPGNIVWYTHSQIRQGHTHRGQLLGAPVGPGGKSQVLAVDRYSPAGDLGLELSRTLYNEDSYNQTWWSYFNVYGHDIEVAALLRGRRPTGLLDIEASLGYSRRWNRNFIGLAEQVGTPLTPEELRREGNLYLEIRAGWRGVDLR
jgi:hypothetical protein